MIFTASSGKAQCVRKIFANSLCRSLEEVLERDSLTFMLQTGGGDKQSTRHGGPV